MKLSKTAVLLANEIKTTIRNVTNAFRIHVRYVFVHAETSLSIECQRMQHQGGFEPKWQLSIS